MNAFLKHYSTDNTSKQTGRSKPLTPPTTQTTNNNNNITNTRNMYKWEPNNEWFSDSSDVVFTVGGKQHRLHKVMLLRRTNYYGEQGTGDILAETVTLSGKTDAFEIAIAYIYNYERTAVTSSTAFDVYEFAVRLKCHPLEKICLTVLNEEPTDLLALSLWRFSIAMGDRRPPARYMYNRLLGNVVEISDWPEFLEIDAEPMLLFLSNNKLNLRTELDVFRLIMKWAEFDREPRWACLPRLLECLRFEHMNVGEFVSEIYNHPNIANDTRIKEKVNKLWDKGLARSIIKHNDSPIYLPRRLMNLHPRICPQLLVTIGGWNQGCPISEFESYDSRVNEWYDSVSLRSLPTRAYHGMATHAKHLYVVGGTSNGDVQLSSMFSVDLSTRRTTILASMFEQRCYVSVALVGGRIYAMGGYNGGRRLRSVESYDIAGNIWFRCRDMLRERSDAGCETIDGLIYIAGGFNGNLCTNHAERYNPAFDQWTAIQDMHQLRSGLSLMADSRYLYAVGGYDGTNRLQTVERYDTQNGVWKNVASMINERSNFACVYLEGEIYALGGFDGKTTSSLSEKYNIAKDRWEQIAPLLVPKSAVKACVVNGLTDLKAFTYYGGQSKRDIERKKYVIQQGDSGDHEVVNQPDDVIEPAPDAAMQM